MIVHSQDYRKYYIRNVTNHLPITILALATPFCTSIQFAICSIVELKIVGALVCLCTDSMKRMAGFKCRC